MSKRPIVLLVFICAIASGSSYAQTINPQSDTLQWNASGFTDQDADTTIVKACQFKSYGSNKIEWIQKNGSMTYTLTATAMEGTWTNVNSDGSLVYTVAFNGMTGTLTMARSGSLSITLHLTGAADTINLVYTITNVETL